MISRSNQSFEPLRSRRYQAILISNGYRTLAGESLPGEVRFRSSKFQSQGPICGCLNEMNDLLNEPNKALEGRRLLVTPAAYAAVAPSNRLAHHDVRHKMKPIIISFDGSGQPRQKHVATGHIAVLVQGGDRSVVQIELLSPNEYGPVLHHAVNNVDLQMNLESFWRSLDVSELTSDRDWLIECPAHLIQTANFKK